MHRLLEGIPGFTCIQPQGAFYAFPNVTGTFGRTIGGTWIGSSLDLAEVILTQAKVAVVPGEAFAAPGDLRLSFALGDDDLGEGIGRIADLLA